MTKDKLVDIVKGKSLLQEIERLDEDAILSLTYALINDLAERKGVEPETMAFAIGETIKRVKEEWGLS